MNKKRPVTIKSIASELGISFSTVSKALNHNPSIKEETRKLVLDKARELGYQPNSLAKSLRENSTKTIAVVFSDIENPVLTYIFRNISIHMAAHGYTTIILDSQFNEATERTNLKAVLSRRPDFIIFEPVSYHTENMKLLEGIEDRLIIQGARFDSMRSNHIHVDYQHGGYLAACELLSKGHRNCLILTESPSFPTSEQFLAGIRHAYDEYGIPFSPSNIISTHASISDGFRVMQELWDSEQKQYRIPFTGVLTFDDNLAFGVYKSAAQNGLCIPEDISVIGFDDNPLSAFSSPPLSTVHLPKEKMAESYIYILDTVLIQRQTEMCIVTLEPTLVSRSSVCTMNK